LMNWGIRGTVLKDVPMKRYTSMRVGGPLQYLVYPADEEDLLKAVRIFREQGVPYRFLGNGTNIIVHDRGLKGAAIRITRMAHRRFTKMKGGASAEVSGGFSLKRFIKDCAERGMSGLERLFWIPGSIGGGIKMNAGSFGVTISDSLESLKVLRGNGEIARLTRDAIHFDYRTSPVVPSECVLSAVFLFKERDRTEIMKELDYVCSERKKRHPMEYPSSGSVFRAVGDEGAWQFVEKAGLRGHRIGDACVSEKHTNFIVNLGNATAQNIKDLVDKVRREVFERLGVKLELEVELWGFNG
jgi:UDP-N-acetylmuramate dehydrogenase